MGRERVAKTILWRHKCSASSHADEAPVENGRFRPVVAAGSL